MENWVRTLNATPGLNGFEMELRATISLDIIKHCALVTGTEGGEDSAGRQTVAPMPPLDVAKRACDIADGLVNVWAERGWVRESTVTAEEQAAFDG